MSVSKFSISLLLAVLSAGAVAQNIVPQKNEKGLWGFIDSSGNEIIKPTYTDVSADPNGSFLVAKGGSWKDGFLSGEKWGVIDADGNVILKPEYEEIGNMFNGAAIIQKGSKYGFVDKNYNIILKPDYTSVGSFNEQGLAWICKGGKMDEKNDGKIEKGKFGVISISGKFIVEPKYKSLGYYPQSDKPRRVWQINEWRTQYDSLHAADLEKQGETVYAVARDLSRLTEECGVHTCVYPEQWKPVHGNMLPRTSAIAFAKYDQLLTPGVCLADGTPVAQPNAYTRVAEPSEGFAVVMLKKKGKITYLDITNQQTHEELKFTIANSFNHGRAVVCDADNKWKFLSHDMTLSDESYTWISPLVHGTYLVRNGATMTMLDGKTLQPIVSDKIILFPPSHGKILFQDSASKLWGFLNADGSVAQAPTYVGASSFGDQGISVVESAGGYGIIDQKFKTVLPTSFSKIMLPTDSAFTGVWVVSAKAKNTQWQYVDRKTSRPRFAQTYAEASNFADGVALVSNGKGWGYIYDNGTIAIPVAWGSADMARGALRYKQVHSLTEWREIDTKRYGTYIINATSGPSLYNTIPNEYWDY